MRLISWNCKKGLNRNEKTKKLVELKPDLAIVQESYHPDELNEELHYEDAIWFGDKKTRGLGVAILNFSKDYQLTLLDENVKYEWIAPIQVRGKENFTLLAVWTKRMPGHSYGRVLQEALNEYKQLLQKNPIIIMGDFNLAKSVPSSFSGVGGFSRMVEVFDQYQLKSCYHAIVKEEFGQESQGTYFHYGKKDQPFHIDYCFVTKDVLQGLQKFVIGNCDDFLPYSDHVPLILEFTLSKEVKQPRRKDGISKDGQNEKLLLTPELFKQKYLLNIDDEFATPDEIEEAINYIKAQRIMRKM